MCGLAGILNQGAAPISEGALKRMCDAMQHRGPDGDGFWVGEGGRIGFGHRRLSIIDLSHSADQPMHTPDGAISVVFNGEIYNHAEIRTELEALGVHDWKTDHSDTEVLLLAYRQWGIDCLHRFRGMFAIALWDARAKALYLVSDRIGIKPLYYTSYDGKIAFASEIKALLSDPAVKRRINEEAVFHYMSFMTAPAPHTLFQDIYKLEPGTWLRIDADGRQVKQRYWEVWDHVDPIHNASEDELAERIIAELRTAVRYRKVADVPVGVFLSGGIDSSTNAALFKEGEQTKVKTFSIGYDGDYDSCKNEFEYARQVAEQIGAEHHELALTQQDLIDFLPRMVWLQDEPLADAVCFPVYYVSKLARDNGVVVAQVGEGADELFCGYPRWRSLLKLQKMNDLPIPGLVKRIGLPLLSGLAPNQDTLLEWLRRGVDGHPIFWGTADALKDKGKKHLLSPRMRAQIGDRTSWDVIKPIHDRFMEKAWDKSDLNWMTHMELAMRLPELLLMRVDKMSMGVSLEARVPFLDHKFVELAMSIPSEMKLRGDTTKYLLKKAVRGVIPDSVIDRPKQPFSVPILEWIFGSLGPMVREEIAAFARDTDIINMEGVDQLFRQKKSAHLWLLLNLAMWWRIFGASTLPQQQAA